MGVEKEVVSLDYERVENYLALLYEGRIKLKSIKQLSGIKLSQDMKGFGYGMPYQLEFEVNGRRREVIFESMRGDEFGHEFPHDRAYNLLLAHSTYNNLSRHVRIIDVGFLTTKGEIRSVGDYDEFFILMEKVEGKEYYRDLEEIVKKSVLSEEDENRCITLAKYLSEIHSEKHNRPSLYSRRIRELLGHGECIMGLIDNYPSNFEVRNEYLKKIEEKCLEWRWKIKGRVHRLSRVHGDFHPWNIIFREGCDFTVLDRSRGEWGEPADDVAALSINYLFFSLKSHGKLTSPFKKLFLKFTEEYLRSTEDYEILEVIQPFLAWRGLVLANPIWYPRLDAKVRGIIFNFIFNVLETEKMDFRSVESYFTRG